MSKFNLFLIVMLGALAALGPLCTDFYLPGLPQISEQLGTSASLSQLTITTSLFGLGIGQLIFGPLSDRFGRKKPLIASLILFVMSSVWCAFTADIYQLIAARFIQGLAGAGGAVLCRAIARDYYQGSALTKIFVVIMAINGIAPIAAPVLGGLQLNHTTWRGLFISLAMTGLLLLVIVVTKLKESYTPSDEHKTSMVQAVWKLLMNKTFVGMNMSQGLLTGGMFAYIAASSYVFQENYHLTAQEYSLLFAFNGAGLVAASFVFAHLSSKFGEVKTIRWGLVVAGISAVTLMISSAHQLALPIILVELFITISFTAGLGSLINSQAMQVSDQNAGTASACLGSVMFGMGGLCAPLTGIGGTSLLSMTMVVAVCYVLAAIFWRTMVPKHIEV